MVLVAHQGIAVMVVMAEIKIYQTAQGGGLSIVQGNLVPEMVGTEARVAQELTVAMVGDCMYRICPKLICP